MPDLFNTLNNLLESLILVKLIFIVSMIFYIIFLLIVLKQVNSMNAVVSEEGPSATVRNIAILNIIAAIILFLTGLVIL
ncbi:MAG: hypothetical protein HYV38_00880 [Candidatus Levybacteria bacterium]|nr:hypothetical protein [Candidatus Levybacteria bacterium]MBI2420623.1 hypothetical protein [Candidatus Levybacteria bacterium]